MKLLLGSLLLVGACWVEANINVPILRSLNTQRIAKAWYPLLSIPTGSVRTEMFPPFTFLTRPNGGLVYRIRVIKNGNCVVEDVPLTKHLVPGDYFNTDVPSTLRISETDYDTYFITYISTGHNYANTFLALAGTQPTVTPALEKKFRKAATRMGITGDILHTRLQETC